MPFDLKSFLYVTENDTITLNDRVKGRVITLRRLDIKSMYVLNNILNINTNSIRNIEIDFSNKVEAQLALRLTLEALSNDLIV